LVLDLHLPPLRSLPTLLGGWAYLTVTGEPFLNGPKRIIPFPGMLALIIEPHRQPHIRAIVSS
jgi:hypothetical protein